MKRQVIFRPCREVCLDVRRSCEVMIHGDWPEPINCNSWPTLAEGGCLPMGYTAPSTTPPSSPATQKPTNSTGMLKE